MRMRIMLLQKRNNILLGIKIQDIIFIDHGNRAKVSTCLFSVLIFNS
jgi:hypothetical protein